MVYQLVHIKVTNYFLDTECPHFDDQENYKVPNFITDFFQKMCRHMIC